MSNENGKEKKPFSVKEFFKSTSFKCIAVLLAIVLVCGILLTICNSLFEVTDKERLDRVLSKIYGKNVTAEEVDLTNLETEYDKGTIGSAYQIKDDGNYLVSATGTEGFDNGTVTCWVVIEISNNAISGIGNVVISDNSGQSYIARVPQSALDHFGDVYADDEAFSLEDWTDEDNKLTGGATGSTRAIVNSVNTAVDFVKSQILGESIAPDIFEDFKYTDEIDTTATSVELADDETSVIFHVTTATIYSDSSALDITVDSTGTISDFKVVKEGTTPNMNLEQGILPVSTYIGKTAAQLLPLLGTEGKDGFDFTTSDETLHTGSTLTNFHYAYAAVFAASNYSKGYLMALNNSVQYTQYVDMTATTAEVSGTDVIFHVTTSLIYSDASALDITVDSTGTITDFKVVKEGTTPNMNLEQDILPVSTYIGKTAAQLLPLLGTEGTDGFDFTTSDETLHTGSTLTNFHYAYAAVFAASNYELYKKIIAAELNAQMSDIYGSDVTVEAVDISGFEATAAKGTVNAVYKVAGTDNYIVSATGNEGFMDGTVTCWIVVETANGAVSGIKNVIIASNVNQSYIDSITDKTLGHFSESFDGNDYNADDWTENQLTGGATHTTTAIVNSVNTAKNFVTANLVGIAGGAQE